MCCKQTQIARGEAFIYRGADRTLYTGAARLCWRLSDHSFKKHIHVFINLNLNLKSNRSSGRLNLTPGIDKYVSIGYRATLDGTHVMWRTLINSREVAEVIVYENASYLSRNEFLLGQRLSVAIGKLLRL